MALSGKRLLAVDWDRRNLRLVLVRPRSGGMELLKAVSVPIPADLSIDDPEVFGAFIREAVRQAKVSAKHAVLSIPRDQVVLNTLNVPAGSEAELPSIVLFQIGKELPFAADQATIDFAVAGTFDPQQSSKVLVAAVRHEQLQYYTQTAFEAGLSLNRIGLRPHANLLSVMGNLPELADKSLLFVEVGPQLTEIDIICGGGLAFSRAASVALPEWPARSEESSPEGRSETISLQEYQREETNRKAIGELMVEIIRSYEAYRATEPTARVDHVVVCGAMGLEPELAEALAGRFAVRAELFAPERAMDLTTARARELCGFSAAIGLALGHDRAGLGYFDFLHPKKPISRRTMQLRKAPVAAMTAVLLIASGVAAHYRFVVPELNERERVAAECKKLKEAEKAVLNFRSQVDALADWQTSEQDWPEILRTLTEAFPPDTQAYATRMDFETLRPAKKEVIRPSTMRMSLRTASLGLVNELAGTLREYGFLNVRAGKDTPFASRNAAEAAYHYDTSIECSLPQRKSPSPSAENGADEKVPSAKANGSDAETEKTENAKGGSSPNKEAERPAVRPEPSASRPAASDATAPPPPPEDPPGTDTELPEPPTSAPAAEVPVPESSSNGAGQVPPTTEVHHDQS